jgi:VCBS repeat-containing protein
MRADVIDKSTGNIVHVPGDSIDLSSPSVVRLDIDRSQITALERQGNDLIVHLANGETIRVSNFYVQTNGAASDLVVREGDHLWLANTAASGPARFAALHGIDDLLIGAGAEAAAGGGGGALLPVLLGGVAVAGGAAALAGGGGGSSRGGGSTATVDTTPPSAPTATVSGNGASVTGTGEAGATVQVRDPSGTLLGSGTVGSNGSYTVTLTQPQNNGQTVTVTQTDPAGNVSPSTTAHAPDTTPPAAPTGAINPNGTIVTGTGEPGATVTVRNGSDAVIGTAVVNAQGSYTVTLTTPQNNGGTLTIAQTDAAGNGSNPINLAAPDITPPSAPTAIMDPHTFTVSGSAEPGAAVTVTDADGRPLGGTVANADGGYSISLPPAVFDGEPVTVVQTDPAGNHSPPTIVTAPDLSPPAAPTASVTPDGTAVTGTGEPGATVTVRDPDTGTAVGTAVVGANGTYTVPLAPGVSDGGTLTVTQTDPSGNVSPATSVTTPDVVAPAAPTATIAADGTSVTGTGEPGATVTITGAGGATIGTAVVTGNGSYFVPLAPPQANGGTLTVGQTDGAGNHSPTVSLTAPDITPPAAPVASVSADGTVVTGTGEPGATVSVHDAAGNPLGTALVAAGGSFSVTLTTPQANGQLLEVSQADPAGNVSPETAVHAPDITAPLGLTAAIGGGGTVVTGSGEPGATVTVRDPGGTVIGTATVAANGSYSATLTTPQTNGQLLQVTQADAAHNVSTPVTVTAPDLTAPAAPVASVSADGTVVTGTGEPGATVSVHDAAGNPLGTALVAAGGSFSVTLTTPQANGQLLEVSQADPAGNVSPETAVHAPDITAPLGLTAAIGGGGTVVTGSGEPGATVTVRDPGGTVIGTATVAANGSYSATLTTPQTNGQLLQVTQADAAHNVSTPVTVTAPDLTAPAAPVASVSADGTVVTGTGEPGATVSVHDAAGNPLGTALVAANGSFSVTLTTPQANGQLLEVSQADPAGNASPEVAVHAPDITAPIGLTAAVNGLGTVVSGSGEAGATVTVRDPLGTAIGTAVVAANGSYSVTLTTPQTNGQLLQVTQADPAGNASTPVPATAPDLTPPALPTATISPDGTTVTGTGEAGATLTVRSPSGTVLGTTTVAADGSYSVTLSVPQTNGEVLTVRQTDPAGNPSPDLHATAPDLTAPTGLTATVNGNGTIVTGTGEAGATVIVHDPSGTAIGTAVVAANGAYAVILTTPQANGQLLEVTQTDTAGNLSAPTPALAPDITPPAAPALAISADGTTATGTGEPGATVTVTSASGAVLGTGPVAADGHFSITLTTPQANGGTVSATQADAAGNVSPPGTANAPDITPPAAPVATLDATGAVVSGTGEPGATVVVRDPFSAVIGTATVSAAGTFSVVLSTPQIDSQVLSVTQTDAAGNASPALSLTAPDLTAPPAPVGTVAADGASITGTGEAGATLVVTDPTGLHIGTVVVASDGTFTTTLVPPQTNGQLLGLVQTDAAGNASPQGSAVAPDLVPNDSPGAPTATVAADGATVFGTGQAGATVSVTGPNGAVIGTATVTPGGTYVVILTTPQLNGETLHVTQADAEGDVSPPATAIAPDLTPPAAPVAAIDATGTIVTGTGEPGATVRVADASGTVLGTATVGANGNYTVVLGTPQTNGQALSVTQADAAANVSPAVPVTAPDTTPPAAPTATVSADGATVTGTGEPGATVTITNAAGTPLGTATVAPGGTYSATLATPQTNGETLTAIQRDPAGNASPSVTATAPDTTPPAAPAATVDATGTLVTGTGEPGATVTVRDAGGVPLGTALVAANGSYVVTLSTAQLNGQHLQVTQADPAGNVSPATPATAPDITPPLAPTGTVSADGTAVTGTGEPGATVHVLNAAGTEIGTAIVAGNGSYTATLTTPQLNGQVLTLGQTDPAGNPSPNVTATAPDLTPPAAPVATVSGDGTIVTGTGEPGATVTVRDPSGTVIGTALVAANGAYAVTLTTTEGNGQTLQVTQADAAGNVSPATSALAPDFTPPLAPTGTVSADGTAVTGTGEPGATVHIFNAAGTEIGTAVVAGNGSYTATLTTPQLNAQVLTLSQTDPAGNHSPSITATAPDLTPPAAPVATVSGDGTVVTGTGEPGATVTVRDPSGTVIGTALVAANGAYAVTLTTTEGNGQTLHVTQADAAGNVSPVTSALAPDFTPPAAPAATVNANGTAVTGTGEPGATVHIFNGAGTEIGTAIVAGNGSYTATLTTPQANGETVTVTQSDPAGNLSPATVAIAPDITPPAPPAGLAINGAGTVVTGTGEAGASVEVRDTGGTLLGTGTVAANGSFSVSLNDPQTAGETLSVTLRDHAGNLSGAVPLIAPFDIEAFNNTASASIDLVPVTTNENLGTANYLALVSLGLLNLDAQVLATPNVQFTVAAGNSLAASFTYDATLAIGVLSGYSVVVQRFDGTNWVAVSGPGNSSLLQLSLLNGNLVATDTLGPGEYRAFVTFDGAAGVGLLGGLAVTGVNSDYTHVGAVQPSTAAGNVITDPGPGGAVDIVSPQTVVQSVTVNGVTTAVAAGGTSIHGDWGTLVINPNGSYTYTPDASAAAIGHVDTFTYTLVNPTSGELESATLAVTIGSPDITGTPLAVDDAAIATATFEHVVTTIPAAIDSSFATPTALIITGAQTGSVHDSFTVGANSTADVTLSAIQSSGLSVLPTYTITVTNSQGTVVGTVTQTSVANLGLGTGVALVLHDLPSGTYNYTVSSTNILGTGYGTNVYVGETVTHLDQYSLTGTTAISGELLANDTLGTDFPVVRVQTGGNFVQVGDTPLTITGAYGTLTVTETGHYTYQPSASLTYSGTDPVDSFTYQLVQPNGTVATAHLDVTVDINNGVTPSAAMVVESTSLADTVPLAMFSAETVAAPTVASTDHPQITYSLNDNQGSVEDLLGQFLHDRQAASDASGPPAAASPAPAAPDIAAAPAPDDPLHYLVTPSDLEQDRHQLTHMV